MMKRNVTKRLLSALLGIVMLIGMIPVIPITIAADTATGTTTETDFISLPITIRDYAADGMLFEFNQVGATGTKGVGGGEPTREFTGAAGGSATSSVKNGYVRYTSGGTGNYITWTLSSETRTSLRYAAIKYRTNAAYSSQPTIGHRASDGDHYVNFDTNYNDGWQTVVIDLGSGTATVNYVSLYPRLASDKYIDIAYIAFFSNEEDATTYNTNGGVYIPAATYNQGDTAGFSLLATSDADYINNLPRDKSATIAGTNLIENGSWGETSDPTAITATLNSGAIQQVYGAWIRTDLVKAELVNGKIEYTEATVTYLAEYMQQIMAVKEQEDDGSYNTYFVTGHELSDLGGTDLAAKIRAQVASGTLGTYADAKAKFDSNGLTDYTQIETWYDAAYFLLHNIFSDNTGYGKTVSNYKNLNLVKTTNADGEPCYVFNSGYDDAVYDYTNGIIYNTQTTDLTIAKTNSGTESYVRGNALPEARFDPLGLSGAGIELGYGMSGDTYGDMIEASTADWAKYYDNTNYNLSLEGHAQFIYYHDDELYFTFTGDDDVYLYINGVRVLDLGAAHSISKVKISLNDVAELCGLEDGKSYTFDFFYMERHGTAANFGIETNIKIVDPAMLTQKTGYQTDAETGNDVEVGYNGFIDPSHPVIYRFQLTNNGETPLKDLEFNDDDLGVYLTSSALTFNSDTAISDLMLEIYNADGTLKTSIPKGSMTDDALMAALAEGIAVGERILIHGIKYNIPADKWVTADSSIYFNNTVYTVGIAHYDNATAETLRGIADYRVQKSTYSFAGDHFYTLGELAAGDDTVNLKNSSTITNGITEAEIIAMVNAGVPASGGAAINISTFNSLTICSASGNTSANYNTRAEVSGKTITYTTPVTGTDTFYFLVTSGEATLGPIRITVYNYGWADNVYVLDYNLPVELNGTNFGFTQNDALNTENPYIASTGISSANATSVYGTFTWTADDGCYNGQSLKYTMNDFMSGIDSVEVTVTLAEAGVPTPDNRTDGVVFTEKIEVAPASVVYYEDDFAGITYVNSVTDDGTGNVWAEYVGSNGKGTEQSADQDSNYGSDPNYTDDQKWGTLTLNEDEFRSSVMKGLSWAKDLFYDNLNDTQKAIVDKVFDVMLARYGATLDGTASNGTIHELILSPGTSNSEVMYFDFEGTGFELISRATQDVYAVLSVEVYEWDSDKTAPEKSGIYYTAGDYNGDGTNTMKYVPVITESEGGDVYEVPVIKIEDLPYSKYRVAVYAANTGSSNTREIYVDGIRIYEPLGTKTNDSDNYLKDVYYSTDEANAVFIEIRPLIVVDKKVVYLDIIDGTITWGVGTTVVEDVGDDGVDGVFQTATVETSDYLNYGPNNEIYLDADPTSTGNGNNVALIAFYITKDPDVADNERTLQIGAHRKIDSTLVTVDGTTEAETGAVYLVYGSTAADIADGIVNANGETVNYLAIESGTEQYITIDPANLTFDETGTALVLIGTMGGENAYSNVLALTNLKIKGYTLEACGDEIVSAVNGTAATMMFSTGFSLRSMMAAPVEDETTTPEETIPEETVPEETVPEETVPEDKPIIPEEPIPTITQPKVISTAVITQNVKSGTYAIVSVEVSKDTDSLIVLDANNNEVKYYVINITKKLNFQNALANLFHGIFDLRPEETLVYTISVPVDEKNGQTNTFSVYAVNEYDVISAEAKQINIRVIAGKNNGKNNKNNRWY